MLKSYRIRRQFYYLLFAISFGFVWYLFKLGGMPKPWRALFSTAIDLSFSLAALIITVELLLPRLVGMLLRGTASSELVHFVSARVIGELIRLACRDVACDA